ncbi:MAG: DegT/DnrJ/EryC1/StrS family aminotransferase [Acidobacteriia bacterium]|nr:DegT/DnrJ/EryC1/StrS family aminotransferase [Terriglobia bacterium]
MTIPVEVERFPGVIGTFMGRDALTLASSYLELSAGDTVLLPAYSCKEVLRPFLKRAHVEFYDIQPNLTIDPDEIRAKLHTGKIKALLIINYFGFLQPFRDEIKQLCSERGVMLIEDCAHSLLTEGSGETGDLVIYSFRKSLPVPDGGGLKLNTNGRSVSTKFYPKIYSNALSVLIIAKSTLRVRSSVFSRAGVADRTGDHSPNNVASAKEERLLPLSSFARAGIARASFADIVHNKRRDFEFWLEVCGRSNVAAPVFESLPQGVCPLGFPIRSEDRDSLMSGARSQGIDLMIHWRLPSGSGSECRNSHSLSAQTLTLPIYPDLPPRHREGLQTLLARG